MVEDTAGVEGTAEVGRDLDIEAVEIGLEVELGGKLGDRIGWSDILVAYRIEVGHSGPSTAQTVHRLFVLDRGSHHTLDSECARQACRMRLVDHGQANSHCQMLDRLDTTWLSLSFSTWTYEG